MAKIDWLTIELAYARQEGTLEELAKRFNVSTSAVYARSSKYKWNDMTIKSVKEKAASMAVAKLVESEVDRKVRLIREHEALVVPIADKLIRGVEHSYDSMQGEAIDSGHLNGLAQALAKANSTARLNLGAVDPGQRIDVTSGGQPIHQRALTILESCRKLVQDGKVKAGSIDVEGLVQEMEDGKLSGS